MTYHVCIFMYSHRIYSQFLDFKHNICSPWSPMLSDLIFGYVGYEWANKSLMGLSFIRMYRQGTFMATGFQAMNRPCTVTWVNQSQADSWNVNDHLWVLFDCLSVCLFFSIVRDYRPSTHSCLPFFSSRVSDPAAPML